MSDLIHLSRFRIVQLKRPLRHAYLKGFEQPIEFDGEVTEEVPPPRPPA